MGTRVNLLGTGYPDSKDYQVLASIHILKYLEHFFKVIMSKDEGKG